MAEPRRGTGLLGECCDGRSVRAKMRGQPLDGDHPPEDNIPGLPNRGHPARADLFDQLIAVLDHTSESTDEPMSKPSPRLNRCGTFSPRIGPSRRDPPESVRTQHAETQRPCGRHRRAGQEVGGSAFGTASKSRLLSWWCRANQDSRYSAANGQIDPCLLYTSPSPRD